MEVEIQSKTNNPLLNRTEVHFIIHHEAEMTPKRDLIRGELAEKLKVKAGNVIVDYLKSGFGSTNTIGYAKVYTSQEKAKAGEKDYLLRRNKVIEPAKPAKEKPKETPETKPESPEKPEEPTREEPTPEEKPEEQPAEKEAKPEEEPAEHPSEESSSEQESAEPPKTEETAEEKKPAEEKKESS
jgi:small subunit ribosomal protein S24e